jgi:AAA15 family ATPase/GTPase
MINEINIEKFKCFENINIKGFKRINLIVGDNGVGKTTLLEYINAYYKQAAVNYFLQKKNFNFFDNIKELMSIIKYISPYSSEEMMMQGILSGSEDRIVSIIGSIYYGNDKAYFFDTIEKSLHYRMMKKFWKVIFELSIEKDAQIFATSYSKEMIAAFAECCLENNWEEEGAYFEMSKNLDSNKIKAIPLTIKDLHETIQDERCNPDYWCY